MKNPWKAQSKVNPQRENGHRRINTEIWVALTKARLPGSVYQVVMYVIDRSWGFDKLEASIGFAQFQKNTGLSRRQIIRAIEEAEKRRLLVIQRANFKPSTYLFNKFYDTWLLGDRNSTSDKNDTSDRNSTRTSDINDTSTSDMAKRGTSYPTKSNTKSNKDNVLQKYRGDF